MNEEKKASLFSKLKKIIFYLLIFFFLILIVYIISIVRNDQESKYMKDLFGEYGRWKYLYEKNQLLRKSKQQKVHPKNDLIIALPITFGATLIFGLIAGFTLRYVKKSETVNILTSQSNSEKVINRIDDLINKLVVTTVATEITQETMKKNISSLSEAERNIQLTEELIKKQEEFLTENITDKSLIDELTKSIQESNKSNIEKENKNQAKQVNEILQNETVESLSEILSDNTITEQNKTEKINSKSVEIGKQLVIFDQKGSLDLSQSTNKTIVKLYEKFGDKMLNRQTNIIPENPMKILAIAAISQNPNLDTSNPGDNFIKTHTSNMMKRIENINIRITPSNSSFIARITGRNQFEKITIGNLIEPIVKAEITSTAIIDPQTIKPSQSNVISSMMRIQDEILNNQKIEIEREKTEINKEIRKSLLNIHENANNLKDIQRKIENIQSEISLLNDQIEKRKKNFVLKNFTDNIEYNKKIRQSDVDKLSEQKKEYQTRIETQERIMKDNVQRLQRLKT